MEDKKTEYWEATLPLNTNKETDSHPDWSNSISFDGVVYEAAAWYKMIRKGNNANKPFISLRLENGSLKVNVRLWPKLKRISQSDPFFSGTETVQGRKFSFSAWLVPLGEKHELRLRIALYGADGSNLSPEAQRVHREIAQYLKQSALSLPADGQTASAPVNSGLPPKEQLFDFDAESDNIPY
jgi:hypothetical protein